MSVSGKDVYTTCKNMVASINSILNSSTAVYNNLEISMNNNATLLDTLLQQAETVAQQQSQQSRLARQAISRQLERSDDETVARQLDAIYQFRPSRLSASWRVAQQLTLSKKQSW
ncbi:hypothetical protein MNBD_CHLOROFLEXI01-3141 [hydrothermal vent metagenome]|uniref:Uncharacterized protein n=1 Tax=hydrothermal vent metagenome TaxID=652676 RepID=A0A3B0V2K8_9ZZZZ